MFTPSAQPFFTELIEDFKDRKISFIVVSHILPDKKDFLEALSLIGTVACIVPKPNSIDRRHKF